MFRISILIFFAFLFVVSCTSTKETQKPEGETQMHGDSVKVYAAFESLRTACRACSGNGDCREAAKYVVYRAREDGDRAWKDVSGYEPGDDQNFVDRSCQGLNQYLPKGKAFEVIKFYQEEESEGIWNVLTIVFEDDEGKTRYVEAAFLKVKGQYLLGDIDGYVMSDDN